MKFSNKKELLARLKAMKPLHGGTTAYCYHDEINNLVYKIDKNYVNYNHPYWPDQDKIMQFSDLSNNTVKFPIDVVLVGTIAVGYISEYVRANNLNLIDPLTMNLNTYTEYLKKAFDDIEDISRNQILANDVMYNILFGKGFCIKDTDEFSKSYLNYENTLYYNKKRFFHECYLFLIDDFFTEFVNKIPALRQKYCSAEGNILDFMNCFRYYLNDAEGRDIVYLKDTVKSRNQSKSLKPHYIRK